METAVLDKKVTFTFPADITKQVEEKGEFHVMGYAATTDFDFQGDVIAEEALKASSLDLVKNSTVLLNHDIKKPIGKVTKVEFDKNGLLIDALISKTEPDIIQKIKEGVLNKFSIRGNVLEREKKYMAEYDRVVNVIKRMSLVEVSLVSVPANPEARAIGWYISKALDEIDNNSKDKGPSDGGPSDEGPQGGESMSEEINLEEIPQKGGGNPPEGTDIKKEETPGKADPPKPEPNPAPPANPEKPEDNPKPKEEPKPENPPEETQKDLRSFVRAQLEPVFGLLDKLIGMGGDAGPIAQQIKAALMRIVGDTSYPYPAASASKSPNPEDIGKLVSTEVQKQLETALKDVPIIRKGLVQKEAEKDELSKLFNGLTPDKKLKVALALQQS